MIPRDPGYTPLPEEYSRVTNPERFAPLHDLAVNLIEQLQSDFDIDRLDGYGFDETLECGPLVRETIYLLPRDQRAAPIAVAFTDFPGLIVRFGQWMVKPFPVCGCDACAETVELLAEDFQWHVQQVTAGRFREAETFSLFWSPPPHGRRTGTGRRPSESVNEWRPWPRR